MLATRQGTWENWTEFGYFHAKNLHFVAGCCHSGNSVVGLADDRHYSRMSSLGRHADGYHRAGQRQQLQIGQSPLNLSTRDIDDTGDFGQNRIHLATSTPPDFRPQNVQSGSRFLGYHCYGWIRSCRTYSSRYCNTPCFFSDIALVFEVLGFLWLGMVKRSW